ncbi:MAG: YceI family protein [Arenimonas sp.]
MKSKLFTYAFLLLTGNAQADAESFDIDPVHTRVAFMVSHAGFSNPIGTFSGSSGQLQFDAKDWSQSSVSVTIPVATLNFGDAKWQEKILSRTYFDVLKFPAATFVSWRIEKLSDNTGTAHGLLNIHGVEQPVELNFTLNALKRHPLSLKKTIGFSATATISRKAFGMGAWGNVIGDDVKIIIELEATRNQGQQTMEREDGDKK